MSRTSAVVVLMLVVAGCARRVVIDPDEVHRHNTEWIQRRPSSPPPARPSVMPAPTDDAGAPPAVTPRTI